MRASVPCWPSCMLWCCRDVPAGTMSRVANAACCGLRLRFTQGLRQGTVVRAQRCAGAYTATLMHVSGGIRLDVRGECMGA